MKSFFKLTVFQACTAIFLSACLIPSVARAQKAGFPNKPITIIVPFAAGGPVDAVARGIALPMSKLLKQPVLIENVAGAGGAIGVAKVAIANPDGYTLVLGHSGTHAFSSALNPKLPYKPAEDFKPIAMLATMASVLSVPAASPFKNVNELIAYAKANPKRLNFGHAGNGSVSHLAALSLMDNAKLEFTFVPYRGSAPAFTDLMSGQLDALFDTSVQAVPQTQGGRVRPLAVTSGKRLDALPNTATFEEACCRNLTLEIWYALFAPKGTPLELVNLLEKAATASLADKQYRATMVKASVEVPNIGTANKDDLEAIMRRDMVRFAELARRTNAKAE